MTNFDRLPIHPNLRAMALTIATLAGVLAAAPASAGNIIHELRREGRFTNLLAAVEAAGLTEVLGNGRNLTLFAPNDTAFARLPGGLVPILLRASARRKLGAILTYHVIDSRIPASTVPTTATLVQTINPSEAKVLALREHGRVTINGVPVLEADIRADSNVIHEVKDVLWPGEQR